LNWSIHEQIYEVRWGSPSGMHGTILCGCNDRPGEVSLVVDPNDAIANAQPAQWALGQLQEALEAQGEPPTHL